MVVEEVRGDGRGVKPHTPRILWIKDIQNGVGVLESAEIAQLCQRKATMKESMSLKCHGASKCVRSVRVLQVNHKCMHCSSFTACKYIDLFVPQLKSTRGGENLPHKCSWTMKQVTGDTTKPENKHAQPEKKRGKKYVLSHLQHPKAVDTCEKRWSFG